MPLTPRRIAPRSRLLAVLALVLAGLAFGLATGPAGADEHGKHATKQRLVVRGDATIVDGPCSDGVCKLQFADGKFRGTPVGTGAYSGSVDLKVADAFPNGEGGVCAPIEGRFILGEGSPDRVVLRVTGDSCQDGAGPVTAASFTGLARFTVEYGTGSHAGARGNGIAVFSEDASDHDRMTLIGRLSY
jgi:hypothetical protein